MVMWLFLPDRKVVAANAREVRRTKRCIACTGPLRRLAKRLEKPSYRWVPNGFICTKCNGVHLDLT